MRKARRLGEDNFHVFVVLNPLGSLLRLAPEVQVAMASAERIFAVLDTRPSVTDTAGAPCLPALHGAATFTDVRFSYAPGREVLRGITFTMPAGQVVALVGPSGAGKSTIAALIPRFYDVQAGTIAVDGQDIRAVSLASLRAQIAIVPQEPVLFALTVRENIAYGRPDATEADLVAAATAANAHEFIVSMADGYDTMVGERGVKLSGGQRQRIAIARALLRDPRILILDEATSSLDSESERLVQEALDHLMAGRTTLVIAHRLSTVEKADQILVLDAGAIVESGTHHQLLEREGMYYRMYTTASRASGLDAGPSGMLV